MPWRAVLMSNVLHAMDECDFDTRSVFRTKYGPFRPARNVLMKYSRRRGKYEARPLLAAALADRFPGRPYIGPTAFNGSDAHDFLEQLGFHKVPL